MDQDLKESVVETVDAIESNIDQARLEHKNQLDRIKKDLEKSEDGGVFWYIVLTSLVSAIVSAAFNFVIRSV